MGLRNVSKYIAGPGRVFITALILLIAVSVVQAFVIGAIGMFASTKRSTATKGEPPKTKEEKSIDRIRQAPKQFLPDGTIHLVYEPRTERGRIIEPRTQQIYDTNDHLLWEGPAEKRPYKYLSWAGQPSRYYEVFDIPQIRRIQAMTPIFSQSIEVPIGSINSTEQIWRYRPGAEYFEGYTIGGGRIGYIGAEGFAGSKSEVKPFGEFRLFTAWRPLDSSSPTFLWQTDRRVYQINFETRQTDLLFESAESEIETINLHAWKDLRPGAVGHVDTKKYRPLLVCITQDGVYHLIVREPDQRLSFAGRRSSVTATREGIFARLYGSDEPAVPPIEASAAQRKEWIERYYTKSRNMWVELYRVSGEGKLELLNRYEWTMPAPGRPVQVHSMMAAQRFVTHFSPPFYNLVLRVLGGGFWARVRQSANRGDFFYGMLQVPLELRPLNVPVNWALSALMMGFVLWHGLPRRVSLARFAFWLVFVGLFNLAGLLTYLALNYTAVIRCPACGRRRGLDQSDCVRCQAPLPTPKPRELDLVFKSCC